MAYYSLKDCWCYVAGVNLSTALETVGAKMTSTVDKWRGCGSAYPTNTLTGDKEATITLAGLYDTAKTSYVGAKADDTNRVWVAGFETDAVSKRFWGLRSASVTEAEFLLEQEKLDRIAPILTASGEVNEGYIVAPLAARTTAGNTQSTYADMGADSASGAAHAFLIVTSITLGGYTNLVVTTQSSDDHITFGDETAFAAVTTDSGQCVDLAGVVEQYLAVKWAWTGSGSGQAATFWVGVARD